MGAPLDPGDDFPPPSWAAETYWTVKAMWIAGHTLTEIVSKTGMTRGAIQGVKSRRPWGYRAKDAAAHPRPYRGGSSKPATPEDNPNRAPLPAGHALTWGAIAPAYAWPGARIAA